MFISQSPAPNLHPSHAMTSREKAKIRASLYAIAHDLFGGLLLAVLIVALAFLFSVR